MKKSASTKNKSQDIRFRNTFRNYAKIAIKYQGNNSDLLLILLEGKKIKPEFIPVIIDINYQIELLYHCSFEHIEWEVGQRLREKWDDSNNDIGFIKNEVQNISEAWTIGQPRYIMELSEKFLSDIDAILNDYFGTS